MSVGAGLPATWSGIAGWYDDLLRAGSGPHELAVATTLHMVPIFMMRGSWTWRAARAWPHVPSHTPVPRR
jgi:hypothetical protein